MKSRKYMKGAEFKERQNWLPFMDGVGIALEVLSETLYDFTKWFKAWKKKPISQVKKPLQLILALHTQWELTYL